MRLVLHNHFPHSKFMVLPPQANTVLRKAAKDAEFNTLSSWKKGVLSVYPDAVIGEDQLGFAAIAQTRQGGFIGKFTYNTPKQKSTGLGWTQLAPERAGKDAARKPRRVKDYVGDDGKVHTFINDDPKQGPCGCGHYRGVDAKPDEYLARVDTHLKTLDPAAKKKFLQKQRVDFEQRYTDFRNRAERNSNNIGPNETAEAYVQTITGLGQRLGSL